LQVETIMQLLEVCLRTTYLQVEDKFFQHKDGMAVGSSLSPIISSIFMKHFKKLALYLVQHKPLLWFWYVDGTFRVWPHGPEWLQNFLSHLNSLRPSTQFTREIESDSAIPFVDVLISSRKMTLATKVYLKPTHTDQYLNFKCNHLLHVKRGLIQSLYNRASTICQEQQDLFNEIGSLRRDLQLNSYCQGFIDLVINS
jgi:hypothetical protein